MDELNDFFDLSKDFVRDELPRGFISGNLHATSSIPTDSKPVKREFYGREYAESISKTERTLMDEVDLTAPYDISTMDTLDDMDDDIASYNYNQATGGDESERSEDDAFYKKYQIKYKQDPSLPIYEVKNQILDTIDKNPVVVLQGDTGCGKTTQVPQYIFDEAFKSRRYCQIVCTQPRRIAAITISRRVCEERDWPTNSICSYQVGLRSNVNEDTRILYCTTGVLLQRLIKDKSLNYFTHILLDEVHERDQEMDFLFIVIRRMLLTNSRNVRIILMSATINAKEFANYFTINRKPAPIMKVDSRRKFSVRTYYTSDLKLLSCQNFSVDMNRPEISEDMYLAALKVLLVIENIEKCEMEMEMNRSGNNCIKSSVLVFLPGIFEIDIFHNKIATIINRNNHQSKELEGIYQGRCKLFPIRLHSMISPEEQMHAFHPPPPGYRKVLLATNIAESSITVSDVKYVIDFCLTKLLVNDSSTNLSTLQIYWASKANCIQRAGRAGRVMNGRVYRMVPRDFFEEQMEEFTQPEMERCPLHAVVLKAKLIDMGSPPEILGLAMSPPCLSDVQNTILSLKEAGALYTHVNGVYSKDDGDLSYWGRIMDVLPIDIHLTRLIIIGYMFSCFEEAIIIAAGLTVRSLFLTIDDPSSNFCDSFLQKLNWADGSGSDLIAIWRAYRTYVSMCSHQNTYECNAKWAKRYQINIGSLREMDILIDELKRRLEFLNITQSYNASRIAWKDAEKAIILKVVFAGAFYPNYFLRDSTKAAGRQRAIQQMLASRDPCNTVYFTNFTTRVMGQLYTRPIKEFFMEMRIPPENIVITFEPGTEKVYATFKSGNEEYDDDFKHKLYAPGRVSPDVWKAVRMRVEKLRRSLRIMDPRMAMRYVQANNIGVVVDGIWHPSRRTNLFLEIKCYPSLFDKRMRGYVSHITSCSKFYFQPLSETQTLKDIETVLNESQSITSNFFHRAASVKKGMVLSAVRNTTYQRGLVEKIITSQSDESRFLIRFIDYGDSAILKLEKLRYLSKNAESIKNYPPRLFECRLASVQPASLTAIRNAWSPMANGALENTTRERVVEIEIYSYVDEVASVIIHTGGNFNEKLIDIGYARKCDEDYASKLDHDFRMRKQRTYRMSFEEQRHQNEAYIREKQPLVDYDIEAPPAHCCTQTMHLRGPFSPLEINMYSILRVGAFKTVNIERNSVNAILLDSDPQDFHDTMIVSSSVTENKSNDKILARSTSIMPNIHGFPALMVMLFSPKMQIKYNKTRTKSLSLLAGLGYDERTLEPLYEEHDLVLPLDVNILPSDIAQVNKIRYLMDAMFHTGPFEYYPTIPPTDRSVLSGNIKIALLDLLNKNRDFVEHNVALEDSHKWINEALDDSCTEVMENVFGNKTHFWMHNGLALNEERFEVISTLQRNCEMLHETCNYENSQPVFCKLCNMNLDNISEIRMHILSKMHQDRERQINFISSSRK